MYSITTAPPPSSPPPPPETCSNGHRSTLILSTNEGGSICLLCLSNLLSNTKSPTVHVSYALSQISQAISQPQFLQSLLTFHSHFLISPLVAVLSNFDDEPIAKQTVDLIVKLCEASMRSGMEDVSKEFVARVSDRVSTGSLAWSRRQLYMLHCFGVLLDNHESNSYACIKNKDSLILNLVTGLQLSSEEIQGEIMFVLYKLSLLQNTYMDDSSTDVIFTYGHKLLHLSLDVLMKSQSDDVRLNCVAFLTVLARRGFFHRCAHHVGSMDTFEADNFIQITERVTDVPVLESLFAEAVKGPMLSSDSQVQMATLELIFLYLSSEDVSVKELKVFMEENIADYIYEILRLSGCKDPIANSSIRILDVLSTAEGAFRQRLAIGFTTLIPVLQHVAGVPFHPVQCQLLKLIFNCVSNCPGIVSTSNAEEISIILADMLKKHIDGEIGMLPEIFTVSCSIYVALMKCSSSRGNSVLAESIRDASRSVFSTLFGNNHTHTDQILHYLYLLKEAYAHDHEDDPTCSSDVGLRACIIDICKSKILPWFINEINENYEDTIVMGVIETFHSILLYDSVEAKKFAENLVSSSWFSVLFGCLGLFPSEKMKWRVYLIFGSIVDVLLGSDSGQPIRDATIHLQSDPTDLLFLLGQKNPGNVEVSYCQYAVLLILYVSSLYNDRIADDKLVLASLEQYILLNSSDFLCGASSSVTIELLVNLYGLYRGYAKMSYQIPYSAEAEKILYNLLAEKEWDSLSTGIHLTSLKWLFQQEKLCKSLSEQLLNFCRYNGTTGNFVVLHHKSSQKVDLHVLVELISTGDNLVAMTFVCLLADLVENGSQEHDIISVVKVLSGIIEIAQVASDQFSIHGIGVVLQNIYSLSRYSSPELFTATSQLVNSILRSVQSESISDDEAWAGMTLKLLDYLIPAVASDGWTEEVITTIGNFCLILHHSTNQALIEASKTILLNADFVSLINITIAEACLKGPALFDHDEGTRTGEVLIFVLFLLLFSLRSVRATLPGIIDFQILLDEGGKLQPLSYVSIRCHDLCKLMHFGSPPLKAIASFYLVELFDGISEYTSRKQVDLKFREGYLLSLSAILEGLIFFPDIRVALNCSRCLSTLMSWEWLRNERTPFEQNSWGRLIIEDLVMYLSTPSLTSNLSKIHHRPAINVAVALLRVSMVPTWMARVFDDSAISSIIQNISPSNVSTELVLLFRELLKSGYLNSAHIADLNREFQACRKHIYTDETQYWSMEKHMDNAGVEMDRVGKARVFLFRLVAFQIYPQVGLQRSQSWKKELLDEIELFTKCLMEEDET